MSYKTKRFREGLSGKKPGSIYIDKEGHRAQEAGYRDHLRNKDLAERISAGRERSRESDDYPSEPSKPLEAWQRALWFCIGAFLIYLDFLLSNAFTTSTVANGAGTYWPLLLASFLLIPGGILGWPGLLLVFFAFSKD